MLNPAQNAESPLDANTRAQLAHEARAVARIGHPGVVEVTHELSVRPDLR
jgi:hypothetical protein